MTLPEGVTMVLPDMESDWTAADLKKCQDPQFRKGVEVLKKALNR